MGKKQDDSINEKILSSSIKSPLTPTKDHPLKDLEEKQRDKNKSDFINDYDDFVDQKPNNSSTMNFNETNQISPEPEIVQPTTINNSNQFESNNNKTFLESSELFENVSESTDWKSASGINNCSVNLNNNQIYSSISIDSQQMIKNNYTEDTDKQTGKFL